MKKFQYDVVIVEVDEKYLSYLNQRGQEGWQIVAQHTMNEHQYAITFMREIDQEAWRTTPAPRPTIPRFNI